MIIGKQIEGRTLWIPRVFTFGGFLFINAWRRSVMIRLPESVIVTCAALGIDVIGD